MKRLIDAERVSIGSAAASVKPVSPALAAPSAVRYAQDTANQPNAGADDGVPNKSGSGPLSEGLVAAVTPGRDSMGGHRVGQPSQRRKRARHNGLRGCEVVIASLIRAR